MQGIADGKWAELDRLYADTATVEYPFAEPTPMRLDGIEAIRRYFAAAARLPLQLKPRDMVIHETGGLSEVVIAEWDYDGLVTTTGRTFQVSNIQVTRVRDGRIVASRDYHNHAAMAEAMAGHPRA